MIAVDLPGLKTQHTSADRLEEDLGQATLAVEHITVSSVESDGSTRRQVTVSFQATDPNKPAVSATVMGMDRIWTEGAIAALTETLERGKHQNPFPRLRVTGGVEPGPRVPEWVRKAAGPALYLAVGAVLFALTDRLI